MIGKRIAKLREDAHLTQSELAKMLDVSPSTIGMWEQERREPNANTIVQIVSIFNTTSDYLLGITNER